MLNFIRFAQDHNIQHVSAGQHHHAHSGWVQTHCPRCTDGRSGFHLGFSINFGNLNCWRCGPIKLIDYLREILNVSIDAAWRVFRSYDDGRRGSGLAKKKHKRTKRLWKPADLGPLHPPHKRYLKARGFDPGRLAKTWSLKGTGALGGRWQWRVVAPIKNAEAETVAFTGRGIRNQSRKYLVTEDTKCCEDPRSFLYGIHKVEGEAVIVVEGPADVWRMGPGAIATLGIAWRPEQANVLKQFHTRFIMFDPDPLAQKQAAKLAAWLSSFAGNTELISDLTSDPGDLSPTAARRIKRRLLGEGR